jgi:autotransporter-associated beta strand protein
VTLGTTTLTTGGDNADTTFAVHISGAGGLTKVGAGTLNLAGQNAYTGATHVEQGTLRAGTTNAFAPASAINVAAGAILDLNGFGQTINASLAGAGSVTLGTATLTTGGNNADTTLAVQISGPGSIIKVGAGTTILAGHNTYTGGTSVTAGRLQVDGSIVATTNVDVGMLGGSGTVGEVFVGPDGVLAPGVASTGILHIGDLFLAASAGFFVELAGTVAGTGYDQAAVTGTVDIAGADLAVLLINGFDPDGGNSFTILANDGPDAIAGTFAGLPQGATFLVGPQHFQINYAGGSDNNDVVLTAVNLTLIGSPGDDLHFVGNSGEGVSEAVGAGYDIVAASVDYVLPVNVEALYMIGGGLTGTGSNNADSLLSSGGPNTLIGLGGDDLFYVNSIGDVVVEAAGGGIDTVIATSSFIMPSEVEALYLAGTGLAGIGSGGADSLLSVGGANIMVGLGGDDLYYVNNSGDVVTELANGGYDSVMASVSYALPANVEAMYLNGSGLTGTGSSGADTLISLGANTLVGGDGNDMLVLLAGSANGATVADFARSEGDVLVFSGFGTEAQGATFTQIGANQWQLLSGLDAHTETITLANGVAVQAGDFFFV